MPTMNDIRAAIKAKILTVANVGNVHEYEPYAKEASALAAKYKFGNPARLQGWHIKRETTREKLQDLARWHVFTGWRIRGFMSIDEADQTERLFDTNIELIRDAFRADDTLGGILFSCVNPDNDEAGIQVLEQRPVLFAGVLCHFTQLGLTTQHLN